MLHAMNAIKETLKVFDTSVQFVQILIFVKTVRPIQHMTIHSWKLSILSKLLTKYFALLMTKMKTHLKLMEKEFNFLKFHSLVNCSMLFVLKIPKVQDVQDKDGVKEETSFPNAHIKRDLKRSKKPNKNKKLKRDLSHKRRLKLRKKWLPKKSLSQRLKRRYKRRVNQSYNRSQFQTKDK